jgi:glycosyltransferase involved in cell wall biosynthesis
MAGAVKSMDQDNICKPRITVIVAVFNGADTLQQCIDSVSQQTYSRKELIIIDGGSRDGTTDLLKANDRQIDYWISEPDSGVYNAWNKGLEQTNGDWVCFLGADDFFWDEKILEKLSNALSTIPPEVRLAYAQVMLIGTSDEALFPVGEPWDAFRDRFHKGACLPHQGVLHRRSLFERMGGFDESFRIGGDYEIMLRELKAAEAVFIPDMIVTGMRQGGLSSNPAETVQAMLDIRRAQKMHGQYWPSIFWLKAMVRVYIRLLLSKIIGDKMARRILDIGRRIKGVPPYWTRT